jgi:alcohol dehydrogenase class IV
MQYFQFLQPTRIYFGCGRLSELANILGSKYARCLMVTTPNEPPLSRVYNQARYVLEKQNMKVGHFDGVQSDPGTKVVERAIQAARAMQADCVLAIGGGSSMDVAKMTANFAGMDNSLDWSEVFSKYSYENMLGDLTPDRKVRLGLVVIPTTSGTGSHVTQAAVITDEATKTKRGVFHPGNYPDVAIVDPELTCTLPKSITAATTFDAFSHAFESYMHEEQSEFIDMYALKAIELIGAHLPNVLRDGGNMNSREKLAFADTCAGISLSNGGGDLPHPLAELIGATCPRIAHGFALSIVYPTYIERIQLMKPERTKRALEALLGKCNGTLESFINFITACELRVRLSDFSVTDNEIEQILESPMLDHLGYPSSELRTMILGCR